MCTLEPISVSSDGTELQRKHMKNLKAELLRLNDVDPDHPKTIKYVSGTPTIVDKD